MDAVSEYLYFVPLVIALQLLTVSVCARHGALWPWRRYLQIAVFLWLATAVVKKAYIDEIHPPVDGLLHEAVAHDVADLLASGRLGEAFSYFGVGNPAYQFLLGTFYAVTGAPEIVTYAINGALAYWGLLVLIEVLCRQTNCAGCRHRLCLFSVCCLRDCFGRRRTSKKGRSCGASA